MTVPKVKKVRRDSSLLTFLIFLFDSYTQVADIAPVRRGKAPEALKPKNEKVQDNGKIRTLQSCSQNRPRNKSNCRFISHSLLLRPSRSLCRSCKHEREIGQRNRSRRAAPTSTSALPASRKLPRSGQNTDRRPRSLAGSASNALTQRKFNLTSSAA